MLSRIPMRLAVCVLLLAAITFVAGAAATHDSDNNFAGNWNTTFPSGKTGTITFKAVTSMQGEAELRELGRTSPCTYAANPASAYYIGTYNGGIGAGVSVSTPDSGRHAGCTDGGITFEGSFMAANGQTGGRLIIRRGGPGLAESSQWNLGGKFELFKGTFAGHFQGDGAGTTADSDGDGLLDAWERNGYDANRDGKVDVDLPKMGADPRHKDIFIEVDKMLHHHLYPEAVKRVVEAFADAPVGNRDGTTGIRLHVDNGPGTEMNPVTGARWGALSRSNPVPHDPVLGSESLLSGDYNWTEFDEIKAKHFAMARRRIFHYAVTGHRYGASGEQSGGLARDIPSSDFIVTAGAGCSPELECPGSIEQQAAILMHELGHNLGLKHGGGDHINYKPNYLSIMNYSFSYSGVIRDVLGAALDYSRVNDLDSFGTDKVRRLDERHLDEQAGLGPTGYYGRLAITTWWCADITSRQGISWARGTGELDWNCDGKIERDVAADVTGDKTPGQVLVALDDWSSLQFTGGLIGGRAATLPRRTPGRDAPHRELVRGAQAVLGDRKPPVVTFQGPKRGRAGRNTIVYATVRDDKALALTVAGLDKKWGQFPHKNRKTFRVKFTVRNAGVRTLRVQATDRVGNQSKAAVFRIRISRR